MNWLLRLYPRPWRDRYGDEFQAFLEMQVVSPRLVLDVLRGAMDAWLHPQLQTSTSSVQRGFLDHDRFTVDAQSVLSMAQGEARRLDHDYIGTEHILLALAQATDAMPARVLTSFGIGADLVRREIEAIVGRGDNRQPGLGDC